MSNTHKCAARDTECKSDEVYERYSLGIYAGRWCDKHWATSGYRKEGASGFDPADCGEAYDEEYY